ncbi:YdiU family protein [Cellulophaga sp. HaHaR_3_176]|uniref:protein adenylyltransferase SelO n=1 Tax=Cellulophaga sp. HaHaR_3_176 TaxID=1942464 RepID=UPI001C1F23A6|nr:YdiU family protein [Cellulophaga sp. HaHaR_3_176]QWX83143.1 YdiU family protein [Cellulophaga sp. HaHaR_3_176]
MNIVLKNTFTNELPEDPISENTRRQVEKACYSYVVPKKTSNPQLIHTSPEMAKNLGFTSEDLKSTKFLNIITGNEIIENSKPYAMCYGGHQFGNWAGQLGDGRAINLGEILYDDKKWALQLKGAGETPYSRTADGLAVLRSSIREYLCSEAMYHLGIPTTRALSIALSGDKVLRDVLYNGNPDYEKGAIVSRVAPSFLRFGSYEIFSSRQDYKTLKNLVDYTIKNFYPQIKSTSKEAYIAFFKEVTERTLEMIIHWQRVGFVHGVMNTDNMSILGLTIDFGPYGWLEGFDDGWTPNTTDRQHKRYRYGNQGNVGLWNLYQLANALYPLIEDAEPLEEILESYKNDYSMRYLNMMKSKIGLFTNQDSDNELLNTLEEVLQLTETDMTIFFRKISSIKKTDDTDACLNSIQEAFYQPKELKGEIRTLWINWFSDYLKRLSGENYTDTERQEKMNAVNPKYVLRNYMAQLAIDKADEGDYSLIETFFELLKKPYSEQPLHNDWFAKRPEWARNKVGCSMLSCSS